MDNLRIEQFRFVSDNGKFLYPIDVTVAEKIRDYVLSHQERFEFVDYALGEREALFRPRPIILPFDDIPKFRQKEYLYIGTRKGVVGVEIDFFYQFFFANGVYAQRCLNRFEYSQVHQALMVILYKDGTWSVND